MNYERQWRLRILDNMQSVDGDSADQPVYLTGPTASGKTAIGVELAIRLDAEIIALDSMTLYRGMDIGTAKPTLDERRGVPHHLIDVLDPWQSASVAEFRGWALETIQEIQARGRRVLLVGGTPLYLKALVRGLFPGPGADAELRSRYEELAATEGDVALHRRLAVADPATAERLHPNDRRRIIRALEVLELTGTPLSQHQTQHQSPGPPGLPIFALSRPRPVLHERINVRVQRMFREGFVEEVCRLREGELPLHRVPAQGVGYREVLELLDGRGTVSETIGRVQARTRQFAKRQETWFRGLSEVRPWQVADDESPEITAERLAGQIGHRK
jgi:tRNA dimethylallyltransferase